MRAPDRTEEFQHGNARIDMQVWCDLCLDPWDGDEPLPPGCELWDLYVKVIGPGGFHADASVGMVGVVPGLSGRKYLDQTIEELRVEAMGTLVDRVKELARGHGVEAAKREQKSAKRAAALLRSGYVARPRPNTKLPKGQRSA